MVSARIQDFSEEISERFQILAESEGFKIFSENSSEGMPFSFGDAECRQLDRMPAAILPRKDTASTHHPANPVKNQTMRLLSVPGQ